MSSGVSLVGSVYVFMRGVSTISATSKTSKCLVMYWLPSNFINFFKPQQWITKKNSGDNTLVYCVFFDYFLARVVEYIEYICNYYAHVIMLSGVGQWTRPVVHLTFMSTGLPLPFFPSILTGSLLVVVPSVDHPMQKCAHWSNSG